MYAYERIPCTVSGRSQYGGAASSKTDTQRVPGNYAGGCASEQTQSLKVTLVFLYRRPWFRTRRQTSRNILTRLLERRFGTLPGPLRQRIFVADVESIEAWVERAFDAPDLQSIFDSN
jgi:hypothetical protein